ncbi:MAG: NAD(P)H-dependent oxidoreductase [Pseudomonadota bacterium]
MNILHIDSSARTTGSVTRDLTAAIVAKLGGTVIRRDLAHAVPHIDDAWVTANFTPDADRTDAQKDALALSEALVGELEAADVIVIGAPLYNFAIPASLKSWIDQISRAQRTFKYTENGPEGLLKGKRAVLAIATGGVPVGSEVDFATGYLRHLLGFLGIEDVDVVAADRVVVNGDAAVDSAKAQVGELAA